MELISSWHLHAHVIFILTLPSPLLWPCSLSSVLVPVLIPVSSLAALLFHGFSLVLTSCLPSVSWPSLPPYVNTHTNYVNTHVSMYTCTSVQCSLLFFLYPQTYISIYIHTDVNTHTHVYAHAYSYKHTHVNTHIHINAYIYSYKHSHIHIHTNTLPYIRYKYAYIQT